MTKILRSHRDMVETPQKISNFCLHPTARRSCDRPTQLIELREWFLMLLDRIPETLAKITFTTFVAFSREILFD